MKYQLNLSYNHLQRQNCKRLLTSCSREGEKPQTLKTLRIQVADIAITLSLTIPQEIIKLSSNRKRVSRNICLASRKLSRSRGNLEPGEKTKKYTTLATEAIVTLESEGECFVFLSERSSSSDSSSPELECADIKLPK